MTGTIVLVCTCCQSANTFRLISFFATYFYNVLSTSDVFFLWGGKNELFNYEAQQLALNTMWSYSWAKNSWNATSMTSYAGLEFSWSVLLSI